MPFRVIMWLKNDAVGNIINYLYSFNSFQATLLLVEVNSQVVFSQGHFLNTNYSVENVKSI